MKNSNESRRQGLEGPAAEWYRERQLRERFGWSKPWIYARLHSGELVGVKLHGILLISASSVRRLLEDATPWKSRKDEAP
jgi:hypothetical protein